MATHRIRRGLDLPLYGAPAERVDDAPRPARAALLAADYVGMKPTMRVEVGSPVRIGDVLFADKKLPAVAYTSPAAGTVAAIERGEKRALQSVVIALDPRSDARRDLATFTGKHPSSASADEVREVLLESGVWTALRARPFGGVADPGKRPRSIFVNAMDSHPLSADPAVALRGREEDFERGLHALAKLTDGPVNVCRRAGSAIPVPAREPFRAHDWSGPHPAGTVGLHIHRLDPVDRHKLVWYAGAQDVLAIGRLFATGAIDVERIVALGGPSVREPRLLRMRLGAAIDDLVKDELEPARGGRGADRSGEHRVVSGSVLSGRAAAGPVHGYLGRYHTQISVVPEERDRDFLGWLRPGLDRFSTTGAFVSALLPRRRFRMTTTTHGSDRAIVPIGLYERVMPMDLEPTFLLKALVTHDVERAEQLGVLELEEEDLGLLSFVCPSKTDYGPHLRRVLQTIEEEG
ncbi:MAG TPA: Na(+)-translocating NADH-quinone reductase subunit A [Thermoanaerobaculia bacterium]|nr:Na(+)-translocating NADH-quinone reductase subunit A [Thermoanaerobaculia bacterium]